MTMRFSPELLAMFRERSGQGTFTLKSQGKLLQFVKHCQSIFPPSSVKGRHVMGFSQSARLRLLRFIATIDWKKMRSSLFVTLTYPDQVCNPTPKERNKQRYLFWRHMENFLGRQVSGLWRIEYKERKTGQNKGWCIPHFHIMVFDVRFVDHKKIRLWWGKALGVTGPLATDVKAIKEGEKAALYISKYMSKETTLASLDYALHLNNFGRHYGFIRKDAIPQCPEIVIDDLTDDERKWLCEFAAQFLPWYDPASDSSFTLLGLLASDAWKEILKRRLANGEV